MSSSVIYNILFFVILFCFLTYSCQWFGRTLKRYQDARREFDEEQRRQNPRNPPDYRFSVYTIEHGRRTLINYESEVPPRSAVNLAMKENELPPTYDDALKMAQAPAAKSTPNITAVAGTQRRNSAAL